MSVQGELLDHVLEFQLSYLQLPTDWEVLELESWKPLAREALCPSYFSDSLVNLQSDNIITLFACRYHTDPSGTFVRYEAKAIGSGSEGAQTSLQENYRKVEHLSICHSNAVCEKGNTRLNFCWEEAKQKRTRMLGNGFFLI